MHIHYNPYAGHVVEVTFRNHFNAYDLFSDTTRLSSSLLNNGNIMIYSIIELSPLKPLDYNNLELKI